MFRISLTLIILTNIYAWNRKIHTLISQLAISNLPDSAKDDLNRRLNFFPIIDEEINSNGELSVIPDRFKRFGFRFLADTHYLNAINLSNENNINKFPKHGIFTNIYLLRKYLEERKVQNDYMDTLALLYFMHLVGDVFQPFHTFSNSGLGNVYRHKSLHHNWDESFGFFNDSNEKESLDILKDAYTNRWFPYKAERIYLKDYSTYIEEMINNKQKENLFETLLFLYGGKEGQYNLFNLIMEPTTKEKNITNITDEKEKLYIRICFQNIEFSYRMMEKSLKIFYKNFDLKGVQLTCRNISNFEEITTEGCYWRNNFFISLGVNVLVGFVIFVILISKLIQINRQPALEYDSVQVG